MLKFDADMARGNTLIALEKQFQCLILQEYDPVLLQIEQDIIAESQKGNEELCYTWDNDIKTIFPMLNSVLYHDYENTPSQAGRYIVDELQKAKYDVILEHDSLTIMW